MRHLLVLLLLLALPACGPGSNASTGGGDPDNGGSATPLEARDYCAASAEMFCEYYMRCGRMNAESLDDCLSIFHESCAGIYEPRYVALEDAGFVSLSEEGLEACAGHLATVDCAQQVFDLDGPCAAVWEGLLGPHDPCGPGMESFVCGAGTTCKLRLDLCGTCEPSASTGEPCGADDDRCEQTDSCIEGVCVRRALPGESCEHRHCVLGASCADGVCERFGVVGVGEECGQQLRCKYNAVCEGGVCREQVGLGEQCAGHGRCRAGYCDLDFGECRPLRAPGETCSAGLECQGGVCEEGACSRIISACFP